MFVFRKYKNYVHSSTYLFIALFDCDRFALLKVVSCVRERRRVPDTNFLKGDVAALNEAAFRQGLTGLLKITLKHLRRADDIRHSFHSKELYDSILAAANVSNHRFVWSSTTSAFSKTTASVMAN